MKYLFLPPSPPIYPLPSSTATHLPAACLLPLCFFSSFLGYSLFDYLRAMIASTPFPFSLIHIYSCGIIQWLVLANGQSIISNFPMLLLSFFVAIATFLFISRRRRLSDTQLTIPWRVSVDPFSCLMQMQLTHAQLDAFLSERMSERANKWMKESVAEGSWKKMPTKLSWKKMKLKIHGGNIRSSGSSSTRTCYQTFCQVLPDVAPLLNAHQPSCCQWWYQSCG